MPKKKLSEQFMAALDDSASREEVFELVKKLTEVMKKERADLADLMAQNKGEVSKEISTQIASFDATLGELRNALSTLEGIMRSELRTTMRYIDQKSEEIRNSIPEEYDDYEVRGIIEQVRSAIPTIPEIPERYDDSPVMERISSLEEKLNKVEEDGRKIVATQTAAVTNLRIRQAFKYILQTEEPTGAIDGNNTSYTVLKPIFAVLSFSINGEVITKLPNYTISGRTITFSTALPAAYTNKDFEITYIG